MYIRTHDGNRRIEWPDGLPYLKQVNIVVELWDIIADELREYRRRNEQRN